jgi:hypothetical protein
MTPLLTPAAFVAIDPAARCFDCDHARAIHGQDPLSTDDEWPTQCLAPAVCPCMAFVHLEGRG